MSGDHPAESSAVGGRRVDPGRAVPVGDAVVAGCGVLGAAALVVAGLDDRIGLALAGLALVAVVTAVATHTAVAGRDPTTARRTAGVVAAAVAVGLFLATSSGVASLLVPALAVLAGRGRTGSWPLRAVALLALVVVAAAQVAGA